VPVSAVQRGAPGTYVYLVNADNTVSVHAINLGVQDGDVFAVESGLSPGDRVVTDGADRLRDGAKVTIPERAHRPTAGAGRGTSSGGDSGSNGQPNRQRHRRPQQQGAAQSDQPAAQSQAP